MAIALSGAELGSRVCGERALHLRPGWPGVHRQAHVLAGHRLAVAQHLDRAAEEVAHLHPPPGDPRQLRVELLLHPREALVLVAGEPEHLGRLGPAGKEALVGVREVDARDAERPGPVGRRRAARRARAPRRRPRWDSVLASVSGSRFRIGASRVGHALAGSVTRLGEAVTSTASRSVARSAPSLPGWRRARPAARRRKRLCSARRSERSPARTVPRKVARSPSRPSSSTAPAASIRIRCGRGARPPAGARRTRRAAASVRADAGGRADARVAAPRPRGSRRPGSCRRRGR